MSSNAAKHAAYKARRREERRADEAGRLVLCPLCDLWLDSWMAQAQHERMAHR